MANKTDADLLKERGIDKELNKTRVLDVIKSAPVTLGSIIPKGWILTSDGLFQEQFDKQGNVIDAEPKRITYAPIVISGVYENITEESQGLIVQWLDGQKWLKREESQDVFMNIRKIVDMAQYGLPVTSNNAKEIINYLHDFYGCNREYLNKSRYAEQFGWIEEGFLWGDHYVSSDHNHSIGFLPSDIGENQLAKGFHSKGDINTWLEIMKRIKGFPRVLTGVYASLGSVLVPLLNCNPFIFEFSGETSKGKTIALKVAASVWGKPTINRDGIIKKWNATPVSIERTSSVLNNLPLFIDDTKDLPKSDKIASLIYNLASGQGKGRGSVRGSQKNRYWSNITFSTGEQKITSFSKDGGTVGRVLTLEGLPFEDDSNETALFVKRIESDVSECYGVVGKEWIKYLLANKNDSLVVWKSIYRNAQQIYTEQVQGNSVVGRLADYMALIHTTAFLFNECFDMQIDYESTLSEVWNTFVKENAEVDRPLMALQEVYQWAYSNQVRFSSQKSVDNKHLTNNDYGYWDFHLKEEWREIHFTPYQLDDFLIKQGYEPQSIYKSWMNRGWLDTTKNRGYRKQKKIKGVQMDFITIKREALEQ